MTTEEFTDEQIERSSLSHSAALKFVFAGNATFTIVSKATGNRFTYKVEEHEAREGGVLHYVSLLQGSNNESSFGFLGTIFGKNRWVHSKKSKVGEDAPSVKGFLWIMGVLSKGSERFEQQAEFWHEGLCCRCGRKLTVPSSIKTGIGPECARIMAKEEKEANVRPNYRP